MRWGLDPAFNPADETAETDIQGQSNRLSPSVPPSLDFFVSSRDLFLRVTARNEGKQG